MRQRISLTSSSFVSLERAFRNLERSLATPVTEPRDLSGIIKDFEMVHELSWKVLKRFLESEGLQSTGPRDVFTRAFQNGYIEREAAWLAMIEDRNQAAHVDDEAKAVGIVERIRRDYLGLVHETFALGAPPGT